MVPRSRVQAEDRDPGSVQLGQLDHGCGQNAGRGPLAHTYGRAGQVMMGARAAQTEGEPL
jgi:hypothetical protein